MQLKEYQDRAVNDKESRHAQPGRGDRKAVRPGKPQRNFTDSAKKIPHPGVSAQVGDIPDISCRLPACYSVCFS